MFIRKFDNEVQQERVEKNITSVMQRFQNFSGAFGSIFPKFVFNRLQSRHKILKQELMSCYSDICHF